MAQPEPSPRHRHAHLHRRVVGVSFQTLGLLVGAPALITGILLGINAVSLRGAAPVHETAGLSVQKYGLAGLLSNGAHGVAKGLGLAIGAASWVFGALAIGALLVTIVSALVFVAGRGVSRQAAWARVVAGMVAVAALASAAALLHALPLAPALADGAVIALSLYSLWVLVWRFR